MVRNVYENFLLEKYLTWLSNYGYMQYYYKLISQNKSNSGMMFNIDKISLSDANFGQI